jgi:hypothetical protein
VLAPGIRRGLFPRRPLSPFILAAVAVVTAVALWAFSSSAPVSTDGFGLPAISAAEIRSVAYFEPDPEARVDRLLVRRAAAGSEPVAVATFPYTFTGLHARGVAAPTGDRIAVLSVDGTKGSAATLTILGLDGTPLTVEGGFEYLSPIAWAPDGQRFAVIASGEPGVTRVMEVQLPEASVAEVARFTAAFQVVPLGYSIDGARLYVVVLDQAGSNLWMVRGGAMQRIAELSPGRTRDWVLSPDGSRVAFIDILSASSRTYVGKTLTIATGAVTTWQAGRNQVGATWQPGNPLPVFGGPGGSLQLEDPSPEAAWVVPHAYAPLGDYLVVSTIASESKDQARPAASLWIATPARRELLTDSPGASFVGWVRGN